MARRRSIDRSPRAQNEPPRRESGQAGAEILLFAFVVIVAMVLVIANVWAIIDTKFMVTAAAREGARSYVESDDSGSAVAVARASVDHAITRSGGRLDRRVSTSVDGSFGRCGRVVVAVTYSIPKVRVPLLAYRFGARTVRASHTELVDPYRSGLVGGVGGICA